ncbi:cell surface glycoprotein 1-like [Nilaparvata lugens]|uniref:cell surface glycoprotein 1-like n=1 Tax=Nilaparvata lugens TaxID=108931 RepID=UPI00193D1886|nr:cell surface glycoprotein 1-like [Nilaparvata lugens]
MRVEKGKSGEKEGINKGEEGEKEVMKEEQEVGRQKEEIIPSHFVGDISTTRYLNDSETQMDVEDGGSFGKQGVKKEEEEEKEMKEEESRIERQGEMMEVSYNNKGRTSDIITITHEKWSKSNQIELNSGDAPDEGNIQDQNSLLMKDVDLETNDTNLEDFYQNDAVTANHSLDFGKDIQGLSMGNATLKMIDSNLTMVNTVPDGLGEDHMDSSNSSSSSQDDNSLNSTSIQDEQNSTTSGVANIGDIRNEPDTNDTVTWDGAGNKSNPEESTFNNRTNLDRITFEVAVVDAPLEVPIPEDGSSQRSSNLQDAQKKFIPITKQTTPTLGNSFTRIGHEPIETAGKAESSNEETSRNSHGSDNLDIPKLMRIFLEEQSGKDGHDEDKSKGVSIGKVAYFKDPLSENKQTLADDSKSADDKSPTVSNDEDKSKGVSIGKVAYFEDPLSGNKQVLANSISADDTTPTVVIESVAEDAKSAVKSSVEVMKPGVDSASSDPFDLGAWAVKMATEVPGDIKSPVDTKSAVDTSVKDTILAVGSTSSDQPKQPHETRSSDNTKPADDDSTSDIDTNPAVDSTSSDDPFNLHAGPVKESLEKPGETKSVDSMKSSDESTSSDETKPSDDKAATSADDPFDLDAWPVKMAAEVPGDIILGGLMMVHEREESMTCGPIMPEGGVQALEAMLYTLDVINQWEDRKFTLGAHILDDCDKDTYGLEMAVDFIKGELSFG